MRSRLADDARKLSMRISAIADVLREADYSAEQGKRDTVGLQQVEEALDGAAATAASACATAPTK